MAAVTKEQQQAVATTTQPPTRPHSKKPHGSAMMVLPIIVLTKEVTVAVRLCGASCSEGFLPRALETPRLVPTMYSILGTTLGGGRKLRGD